jgi:hypothetical protein
MYGRVQQLRQTGTKTSGQKKAHGELEGLKVSAQKPWRIVGKRRDLPGVSIHCIGPAVYYHWHHVVVFLAVITRLFPCLVYRDQAFFLLISQTMSSERISAMYFINFSRIGLKGPWSLVTFFALRSPRMSLFPTVYVLTPNTAQLTLKPADSAFQHSFFTGFSGILSAIFYRR